MTAPAEPAEKADPADAAEPTEKAEATEPTEPIESAEPTEPIERTEPFDPIESSESCEQKERALRSGRPRRGPWTVASDSRPSATPPCRLRARPPPGRPHSARRRARRCACRPRRR